MLKFYYNLSPNPTKVALFLEEAGLPYEPVPVEAGKGEQFSPAFIKLNPNSKLPVIVDEGVTVFDSSAILLYLAEKTGKFLPPESPTVRGELLSWLMFAASGLGPFCGQAVHFKRFAPEPVPYAQKRYDFEAERHLKVVDARLAQQPYMLGSTYTIVDMAVWGWARAAAFVLGEDRAGALRNLTRLVSEINARPAAARAAALKDRHNFKELDDEARRILFPHWAA
jgi:GSH-dependent disulfide-bond oxidoreductase